MLRLLPCKCSLQLCALWVFGVAVFLHLLKAVKLVQHPSTGICRTTCQRLGSRLQSLPALLARCELAQQRQDGVPGHHSLLDGDGNVGRCPVHGTAFHFTISHY